MTHITMARSKPWISIEKQDIPLDQCVASDILLYDIDGLTPEERRWINSA